MRVVCLGGGPAGLYFAISMKLRDPSHEVLVVERNKAGDTFGWGVVFSDQTLGNLRANDPASAAVIEASFAHWDDVIVDRGDESVRSGGHGFIGIGRKRLLNILQDRARELGVELRFETEFDVTVERELTVSGSHTLKTMPIAYLDGVTEGPAIPVDRPVARPEN